MRLDPRVRAARLAAVLYALGAGTLLGSVQFLPAGVDRPAVVAVAGLALGSIVPLLAAPWRRFPSWAMVVPLVWGVLMISLVGAWGGGLSHFVLFYGLASLYVGITQRRGSWVWVLPLNLVSVAVALAGREPVASAPDLIGAAVLAAVIGEVLAGAVASTNAAALSTRRLLGALTGLQHSENEVDAADQVALLTTSLLSPDVALVMVAAHPGSLLFVNRGQRGIDDPLGRLIVDTSAPSGIRVAMGQGAPLFVSEAHRSPLVARSVVARLQLVSLLFVPVAGEGGYLGCLVLGWRTRHSRLTRHESEVVSALADTAGPLLARLRSVGALEKQALTDPLTDLANRRAFLLALNALSPGGAVVFIDLDHFKALNDSQGHLAGDAVLVDFARALRRSVRAGDCAARYGGEEFALVLPDEGAARTAVRRLRESWQGPVTFSTGIALHRADEAPAETLARADRALYDAKAAGRNTLIVG